MSMIKPKKTDWPRYYKLCFSSMAERRFAGLICAPLIDDDALVFNTKNYKRGLYRPPIVRTEIILCWNLDH